MFLRRPAVICSYVDGRGLRTVYPSNKEEITFDQSFFGVVCRVFCVAPLLLWFDHSARLQ